MGRSFLVEFLFKSIFGIRFSNCFEVSSVFCLGQSSFGLWICFSFDGFKIASITLREDGL